jgi:hypothetical protein
VRHHARRDGTAFSSRTAIGGGLPIKVTRVDINPVLRVALLIVIEFIASLL